MGPNTDRSLWVVGHYQRCYPYSWPLRCILVDSAQSDHHLLGHSIPAEKDRLGVSGYFLGWSAVYLHLRSYVHNYLRIL